MVIDQYVDECEWAWSYGPESARPPPRLLSELPNESDPLDLIPLSDLVAFCRTFEGEKSAVESAYLAAVSYAQGEGAWRLTLGPKPFEWQLPCWPTRRKSIDLLAGPVVSVDAFKADGRAVAQSKWDLHQGRYLRCLTEDGWPEITRTAARPNPICIRFTAGYTDETLPAELAQALKLLTNHFYVTRGATVPPAITGMLNRWRRITAL